MNLPRGTMRRLLRQVTTLKGKVDSIEAKPEQITWGSVVEASPLRVLLDGDATPLSCTSAIGGLAVGARVVVQRRVRPGSSAAEMIATAQAGSADRTPVGVVEAYAGTTAPTGWLLCDGSTFAAADYPALASILGTTYGGTVSNPALPDLRGRTPVGTDATQVEFETPGVTGGEKTHALTSAENATHTHSLPATVTTFGTVAAAGGSAADNAGQSFVQGTTGSRFNKALAVSGTLGNSGSGTPHNNLQPYITLNYIIRAEI